VFQLIGHWCINTLNTKKKAQRKSNVLNDLLPSRSTVLLFFLSLFLVSWTQSRQAHEREKGCVHEWVGGLTVCIQLRRKELFGTIYFFLSYAFTHSDFRVKPITFPLCVGGDFFGISFATIDSLSISALFLAIHFVLENRFWDGCQVE
jgi:hypothetical protein